MQVCDPAQHQTVGKAGPAVCGQSQGLQGAGNPGGGLQIYLCEDCRRGRGGSEAGDRSATGK